MGFAINNNSLFRIIIISVHNIYKSISIQMLYRMADGASTVAWWGTADSSHVVIADFQLPTGCLLKVPEINELPLADTSKHKHHIPYKAHNSLLCCSFH